MRTSTQSKDTNKVPADESIGQHLSASLFCLILVISVMVARVQEVVPGLSHLYLGKISLGMAIFSLIFTQSRNKVSLLAIPQMRYVIYLLILGTISAPFGYWPSKSLNFLFFQFSYLMIMLVLMIKMTFSFSETKKIIFWTIASITMLGCAAIILSNGGRAASSSTYDPNDIAFIMVIFFPIIYFAIKVATKSWQLFLAGSLLVSFVTIILTQSRGGFLAFSVVALTISIQDRRHIFKILLGLFILAIIFVAIHPVGYIDRMSTIINPQEDYNVTASEGRIEIWKRGLSLVIDHPLLGVGPGAFDAAEMTKGGRYRPTHNSFIQIAAEFGILGFILFMAIIITSIRSLRRIRSDTLLEDDVKLIACGVEIAFYGYMSAGFFLSQAYAPVLFFLVGLSIVLNQNTRIIIQ